MRTAEMFYRGVWFPPSDRIHEITARVAAAVLVQGAVLPPHPLPSPLVTFFDFFFVFFFLTSALISSFGFCVWFLL
jgi:hypothetical protein